MNVCFIFLTFWEKTCFCLFLFFKIGFFLRKVLPNISVEQHLGVEK